MQSGSDSKRKVRLCIKYSDVRQDCNGKCGELHICRRWLGGSCTLRDCELYHSLTIKHNLDILEKNGFLARHFEVICEERLRRTIYWQFPVVCNKYNAPRSCTNEENCGHLHICKRFLNSSTCPCSLRHNLGGSANQAVLARFGMQEGAKKLDVATCFSQFLIPDTNALVCTCDCAACCEKREADSLVVQQLPVEALILFLVERDGATTWPQVAEHFGMPSAFGSFKNWARGVQQTADPLYPYIDADERTQQLNVYRLFRLCLKYQSGKSESVNTSFQTCWKQGVKMCTKLHLCRFFVADLCPIDPKTGRLLVSASSRNGPTAPPTRDHRDPRCTHKMSHTFDDPVLIKLGLSELPESRLLELVRISHPRVCRDYTYATCMDSECHYMHVCNTYVAQYDITSHKCGKNHDIMSEQCMGVLDRLHLTTIAVQKGAVYVRKVCLPVSSADDTQRSERRRRLALAKSNQESAVTATTHVVAPSSRPAGLPSTEQSVMSAPAAATAPQVAASPNTPGTETRIDDFVVNDAEFPALPSAVPRVFSGLPPRRPGDNSNNGNDEYTSANDGVTTLEEAQDLYSTGYYDQYMFDRDDNGEDNDENFNNESDTENSAAPRSSNNVMEWNVPLKNNFPATNQPPRYSSAAAVASEKSNVKSNNEFKALDSNTTNLNNNVKARDNQQVVDKGIEARQVLENMCKTLINGIDNMKCSTLPQSKYPGSQQQAFSETQVQAYSSASIEPVARSHAIESELAVQTRKLVAPPGLLPNNSGIPQHANPLASLQSPRQPAERGGGNFNALANFSSSHSLFGLQAPTPLLAAERQPTAPVLSDEFSNRLPASGAGERALPLHMGAFANVRDSVVAANGGLPGISSPSKEIGFATQSNMFGFEEHKQAKTLVGAVRHSPLVQSDYELFRSSPQSDVMKLTASNCDTEQFGNVSATGSATLSQDSNAGVMHCNLDQLSKQSFVSSSSMKDYSVPHQSVIDSKAASRANPIDLRPFGSAVGKFGLADSESQRAPVQLLNSNGARGQSHFAGAFSDCAQPAFSSAGDSAFSSQLSSKLYFNETDETNNNSKLFSDKQKVQPSNFEVTSETKQHYICEKHIRGACAFEAHECEMHHADSAFLWLYNVPPMVLGSLQTKHAIRLGNHKGVWLPFTLGDTMRIESAYCSMKRTYVLDNIALTSDDSNARGTLHQRGSVLSPEVWSNDSYCFGGLSEIFFTEQRQHDSLNLFRMRTRLKVGKGDSYTYSAPHTISVCCLRTKSATQLYSAPLSTQWCWFLLPFATGTTSMHGEWLDCTGLIGEENVKELEAAFTRGVTQHRIRLKVSGVVKSFQFDFKSMLVKLEPDDITAELESRPSFSAAT